MNKQQPDLYTIHPPIVHVCTKFQLCVGLTIPKERATKKDDKILMFENWRERKSKEQISSKLVPVYTIHPPIVNVYQVSTL